MFDICKSIAITGSFKQIHCLIVLILLRCIKIVIPDAEDRASTSFEQMTRCPPSMQMPFLLHRVSEKQTISHFTRLSSLINLFIRTSELIIVFFGTNSLYSHSICRLITSDLCMINLIANLLISMDSPQTYELKMHYFVQKLQSSITNNLTCHYGC